MIPRLLLTILVTTCVGVPALADPCIEMSSDVLLNTLNDCASAPGTERSFNARLLRWGAHDFMLLHIGNELEIYRNDIPLEPQYVDGSHFDVPNAGDSDYDLINYSVCDDCRWGIANFKVGTVLFDFGTEATPAFADFVIYPAGSAFGAMTFEHGGQQYLIANNLDSSCGANSALYEFNGIEAADLTQIDCVEAPPVFGTGIKGGHYVDGYLYLGDRSTRVFLYQVQDTSATISLSYISTPMYGGVAFAPTFSVDHAHRVMVDVNNINGVTIWDVSNPGSPVAKANIAGDWTYSSVAYPLLWLGKGSTKGSEATFDISNLSSPMPMDTGFWDGDQPWNFPDTGDCAYPMAASFAQDGTTLYLPRWGIFQMADLSACEPTPEIFADSFESGNSGAW